MTNYNIMLDGPNVQEAVLYTGDNGLGEIGRWAAQYQEGQISVQLGLDITTMRILSMDDIVGNSETTLDEWFGERATG